MKPLLASAALLACALTATPASAQRILDDSLVAGMGYETCARVISLPETAEIRTQTGQWALGYLSGWLMFDIENAIPELRGLDAGLRRMTAAGRLEDQLADRVLAACRTQPSLHLANAVTLVAFDIAREQR